MMLTRSHIQSLTIALVVLLMGAIPVYFAVSVLRTTQGALVESRAHDRALESTFDARSKIEKHLVYFSASALEVDDPKREAMLLKANRHIEEFDASINALLKSSEQQLTSTKRHELRTCLSEILRNWEKINWDGNRQMSVVEKNQHFMSMVRHFEKLDTVLAGLHKQVSEQHEQGLRRIFSNIEMAIFTIVILMIVGTGLASFGLGGSNYLLNMSKALSTTSDQRY